MDGPYSRDYAEAREKFRAGAQWVLRMQRSR
jgi:hypothetical protein